MQILRSPEPPETTSRHGAHPTAAPDRGRAEESPEGIVLAIGVDAYRAPIRQLRAAVSDAKAIAAACERRFGFESKPLLDEAATAAGIMAALEALGRRQEKDHLLVYFAGHADVHRSETGRIEGVLLPSGAVLDEPATLLAMSALRRAVLELGYAHVLVIFDCCSAAAFSDSEMREVLVSGVTRNHFERYRSLRSAQFIASAATDEKAQDTFAARTYLDEQHSPFAVQLLTGLDDGVADLDHDGVITSTDLASWLTSTLRVAPGMNRQTVCSSTLEGHGGGFSLPNGMHGFYLANDKGDRVNAGPTELVFDRPAKDKVRVAGSCFSCHMDGLREDFVPDAANPTLLGALATDNLQYRVAARQFGEFPADPIFGTVRAYERDLEFWQIAAELGRSGGLLAEKIKSNAELRTVIPDRETRLKRSVLEANLVTLSGVVCSPPQPWPGSGP